MDLVSLNNEQDIQKLAEIVKQYSVITKVELLPFKKLCVEKYDKLGIKFPLADTPEFSQERLKELDLILNSL